jgi:hypothetical protein
MKQVTGKISWTDIPHCQKFGIDWILKPSSHVKFNPKHIIFFFDILKSWLMFVSRILEQLYVYICMLSTSVSRSCKFSIETYSIKVVKCGQLLLPDKGEVRSVIWWYLFGLVTINSFGRKTASTVSAKSFVSWLGITH